MIIDFPNRRPTEKALRAKRSEIAKRYARANRKKFGPLSFAAIRMAELSKVFAHRYSGLALPDSDDGVQMVRIMVHHMGRLRDAPRRISQWCMRHAPWLELNEVERLIRDATEHPLKWKADRVAWMLRITAAERAKLKLRTIGAVDQTKLERQELVKRRKTEQRKIKRRAAGAVKRDVYEGGSAEAQKPWVAEGISRRTWYRKRVAQV